jgi:alcohol dehydrogenase
MFIPNELNFTPKVKLIIGNDSLLQLGELAKNISAGPVLLVTDPGVVATGHVARAVESLESADLSVSVFDKVIENPTTKEVDLCVEIAVQVKPTLIVGLGGGSSMDTAKGCNFIYTNGGQMADYWGVNKATKTMLPLIAIPTTSGTGSECQSFALIADAKTHRKMACGDSKALPVIAIIDPILTLTQPSQVTAATGIDAITHAIESAVSKNRNDISTYFSIESLKSTMSSLPIILENPADINARESMLIGAAYAGLAIENSMLGGAHASANPITAKLGVVHGFAVGMMLPAVIKYNATDHYTAKIYQILAINAGLIDQGASVDNAVSALINQMQLILKLAKVPIAQIATQIDDVLIGTLSMDAQKEWTGSFNPREINTNNFEKLYNETFNMNSPLV